MVEIDQNNLFIYLFTFCNYYIYEIDHPILKLSLGIILVYVTKNYLHVIYDIYNMY